MTQQLFQTEPLPGEQWAKPNSEALTVIKVWAHPLHSQQTWIHAAKRSGDWFSTSGPLDKFLEHGYRRVK